MRPLFRLVGCFVAFGALLSGCSGVFDLPFTASRWGEGSGFPIAVFQIKDGVTYQRATWSVPGALGVSSPGDVAYAYFDEVPASVEAHLTLEEGTGRTITYIGYFPYNLLPVFEPSGSSGGSCCQVCVVGKPCGDSCISRADTCHVPAGCACSGSP